MTELTRLDHEVLTPVPYEGWRSQVALIAWQAGHMLTVAGVRA